MKRAFCRENLCSIDVQYEHETKLSRDNLAFSDLIKLAFKPKPHEMKI